MQFFLTVGVSKEQNFKKYMWINDDDGVDDDDEN